MKIIDKLKVNSSWFFMKRPLPYPLIGKEGKLAKKAIELFDNTDHISTIHRLPKSLGGYKYRSYVFNSEGSKKALVVHGWMSASAFMIKQIQNLIEQNYRVIAIDLPSHGKNQNILYCTWREAVHTILETQKYYGKFDLCLGHSFGGGMLINASGLQNLSDEFDTKLECDKYVLLASALSIKTPVRLFSKLTALNQSQVEQFQNVISKDANINFDYMSGKYLETTYPTGSKFLVIHGDNDKVVSIKESEEFAEIGSRATLEVIEGMGHLEIIYSEKVIQLINQYI